MLLTSASALAQSPSAGYGVVSPVQAMPAAPYHMPGDVPGAAGGTPWHAYPTYPNAPASQGYGAMPYTPVAGAPLWITVDDAPQLLDGFYPAGGPLERHTSRPGAWYGIAFVPLASRWPVQLWAWQRTRPHQLRITVLDAWPASAAQVAVAMPLRTALTARGRPLTQSAPFVLPPASSAEGVYLLLEQWSAVGERPSAVWLQARTGEATAVRGGNGWWSAGEPATYPVRPLPGAPPSALLAPRSSGGVVELPILRLISPPPRPAPAFDPWWER